MNIEKIEKDITIALEHLDRFAPTDEEARLDFDVEMASVHYKLEKGFIEQLTKTTEEAKREAVEDLHRSLNKWYEETFHWLKEKKEGDYSETYVTEHELEQFFKSYNPTQQSLDGGETQLTEKGTVA